jgi:hypothetical protein
MKPGLPQMDESALAKYTDRADRASGEQGARQRIPKTCYDSGK